MAGKRSRSLFFQNFPVEGEFVKCNVYAIHWTALRTKRERFCSGGGWEDQGYNQFGGS
jgi:hypothetical protein